MATDLFASDGLLTTEENDSLLAECSFFFDTPSDLQEVPGNPEGVSPPSPEEPGNTKGVSPPSLLEPGNTEGVSPPSPLEPGNTEGVTPPSHELHNFLDYAAQADVDLITLEDYFPDVEEEQCGSGLEQSLSLVEPPQACQSPEMSSSENGIFLGKMRRASSPEYHFCTVQREQCPSGLEQNPSLSFSSGSDSPVELRQACQSPNMSSPENGIFLGETGRASSTEYHFFAVQGEQCPSGPEPNPPRSDALVEPPVNGYFTGLMIQACSPEGLQNHESVEMSLANLALAKLKFEQLKFFKVKKYNADEMKKRISKHIAKRSLRNFNKTIRYQCRKTVADNMRRRGGRFVSNSYDDDDDDDLSVDSDPTVEQNPCLLLVAPPQNGYFTSLLRQACSPEGLQNHGSVEMPLPNPLAKLNFFKVEKYNVDERKERISKHNAKRTLRNFNNTIKYPCRKTFADSRPRIGGMFVPEALDDDDDDLSELHEGED